jgi:glycosyltransferase involved in cell wall biosynthesis
MEEIVRLNGQGDWRFQYQEELQHLLKQPGVVNHGRVGQEALWEHWAQTNVWLHPTDFPETSMITCMEAQALGAIPVINRLWATKTNILDGYQYDGIPQKSAVIRSLMVEKAVQLLNGESESWDCPLEWDYKKPNPTRRSSMQEMALTRFDWSNIVKQWSKWIEKDSE